MFGVRCLVFGVVRAVPGPVPGLGCGAPSGRVPDCALLLIVRLRVLCVVCRVS